MNARLSDWQRYRAEQQRLAACAHAEREAFFALPPSAQITRFEARPNEVRWMGARFWGGSYGCGPDLLWDYVGVDGEILPDIIRPHAVGGGAHTCHPLDPDPQVAVEMLGQDGGGSLLTRLNIELRGISRATWLACLWMGADMGLIQPHFYGPDEVERYWSVAWKLRNDAQTRARMIAYWRGLLERYAAEKFRAEDEKRPGSVPKRPVHQSIEALAAVAELWGAAPPVTIPAVRRAA